MNIPMAIIGRKIKQSPDLLMISRGLRKEDNKMESLGTRLNKMISEI
jgi:hypothetical protein